MDGSRRAFLRSTTLGGIAASTLSADTAGQGAMPARVLGRTGARVSILAFGCGSRFLMYKDDEQALEALNRAIDRGITYVDTAYAYGNGASEIRVGKVMKTRRKEVWLATKVEDRTGDGAMRIIEGSLKRLQTDHLDLIHMHSLTDEADLAKMEAPDGVLKRLYQLRDQKVTRAIGVTSHTDPVVLKTAIERFDLDCTQMALNAARVGMAPKVSYSLRHSFETIALPAAKRKNLGVIAMKVFAQEKLSGKAPAEQLVRYALSLPVSAAVIGMPTLDFLDHNIATAKSFRPMTGSEMRDLSDRLAGEHKAELDRFFAHHLDV